MNDVTFREVKIEKNTGVIIDNKSRFKNHMYAEIKKADGMMGLIRSLVHLDEDICMKLYKSVGQPHLEYTQKVWFPAKIKGMKAWEDV